MELSPLFNSEGTQWFQWPKNYLEPGQGRIKPIEE